MIGLGCVLPVARPLFYGGNMSKNVETVYDPVKELIKNGRKTIAEITSIAYKPVLSANVEYLKGNYVCHQFPVFMVEYKFNPPDDRRKQDIIHEFLTHIEPENHYCVGDRIPILYQIEDKYSFDVVTSMPFPMPLVFS